MPLNFYEHEVEPHLKHKQQLRSFIKSIIHKEAGISKVSLNYIFCNDEYLLGINQQYLQHDTYTDIITFNLSDKQNTLKGEIYISIPRVKENALEFNATYNQELLRVIFHGTLHLCGYEDGTAEQKATMRAKENEYINAYNEIVLTK
ncbi:MAG: rRNA maturation RNase YbeY [Chitinophagia bacterium]|nr:rRNA maturation RNase YbeY [Chitinophagia bacterium]